MEYPGYGLYVGETGSDKVLNDALFVFDHLVNKLGVSSSDIVVFGRSIGCCPASYLAKNRNPAALILMSPFKSIRDVAKDLVGRMLAYAIADRFRNIDTIRDIRCPVFIVHGQKDKLIPY
jgi:esterase/lipase